MGSIAATEELLLSAMTGQPTHPSKLPEAVLRRDPCVLWCRGTILADTLITTEEAAMGTSIDMKFEIVVIPVSDVDRAKDFYGRLGWRLDAEFANGDDFRVIQFTPPGSGCSIIF